MTKKQTYDKVRPKDQLAPTQWRIYLLICIVGFMITGIMGYGFFKGNRMNKVYAPLIDAAMEIQLEATIAHLWFEEIISGDSHEDINAVWKHQEQAEWYAKAMLEGGENQEGTFIPLHDTEMRRVLKNVQEKLKEFRKITKKRIEAKGLSGVGTDIDQRYDHIFRSFMKEADEVETRLQKIMAKDLSEFRYTQVFLIVTSILLFLAIGIFVWYFDKKRVKTLILLSEANRAAREREVRFSSIFDQSPIGIELYDSKGNLVDANPKCLEIFGIPNVEAVKGFKLFADPNISDEFKKRLFAGEQVSFESEFDFEKVRESALYETSKTGKIFVKIFANPWKTAEPGEDRFLVHVMDITERIQKNKELNEHRYHLEELVEERTAELKKKMAELERMNDLFVGREFRIKELRDRVKELEKS